MEQPVKNEPKQRSKYSVELFDPKQTAYQSIYLEIREIEDSVFPNVGFDDEELEETFTKEGSISILLKDEVGVIVGYSNFLPYEVLDDGVKFPNDLNDTEMPKDFVRDDEGEHTAYVYNFAIKEPHRGDMQFLRMVKTAGFALRKLGFTRIEADAEVAGGLPEMIDRMAQRRNAVIYRQQHTSEWSESGQQVFFRLDLQKLTK